MPKQTYTVQVNANALRTMRVVASSPAEALDLAWQRIERHPVIGPWTMDFPGSADEHFTMIDKDDRIRDVEDDGTDDRFAPYREDD